MLWRVHPQTVNLIPLGKHSWFDSKLLHQVLVLKCSWTHDGLSRHKSGDRYPLRPPSFVKVSARECHAI